MGNLREAQERPDPEIISGSVRGKFPASFQSPAVGSDGCIGPITTEMRRGAVPYLLGEAWSENPA